MKGTEMTIRNKTANIYTEWLPLIDSLPNEIAGVIFKNILKYQNGDDIKSDFPVWLFIKSKIDEYNDKLSQISEKRKESGRLGGLANASKCYQMEAKDSKSSNKIKENKTKQNKIKQNNYNHYGELNNVCLTEEDYNKLLSIHPNLNEAIEVLDTWLGTSGSKNKNKNHYAYFKQNSWVWDRVKPTQQPTPSFENLFHQEKPTQDKINSIIEQRKKDDEEREKNRLEAERWTAFINSKGYPNILAVVSAGQEVYEKLKAEYRQAGNQ